MITVSETVQTKLPAEEAFAYLCEFEHTSEWDPGTPLVEKKTPGPVAVGSNFYAEAQFRGKRQPINYVVTELSDSHIELRGENKTIISVDTINVRPSSNGSTVTYTAKFSLKGILKVAEFLLKSTFQGLAKPAADGLKRKLDQLAAMG